jgi:hypothetical protein
MSSNVIQCTDLSFSQKFSNLFDSFSGGMHVDPGKTLLCPLKDNILHIDYWTKARMELNVLIFLKDSKRAFL